MPRLLATSDAQGIKGLVMKQETGRLCSAVFLDHRCYLVFAHKLQLMHVLLKVSASRFIIVPAILKRFKTEKAVTDRNRPVGEVVGLSHLFAEVGGRRECDKLALEED
ncbi:hypothetical protein V6N11_074596 [Hibiscus sabdariffa]|uniref:Uncharacterized protein n=1 Tax=Hibiscus sabdariffa TaxID=183260 RepID=A0ABR2R3Z9_9ROSI